MTHGATQAGRGSSLEAERLAELLQAAMESSEQAFAQFADRPMAGQPPGVQASDAPLEPGTWSQGVFFQVAGDLSAQIAILLSDRACAALARRGARGPGGHAAPEALRSMLLELGNIVASRTVSAIADASGGRILLSVPSLVTGGVERELHWRARRAGRGTPGLRVDCEFVDSSGAARALLVLIPEVDTGAP